jgi:Zn-dependent protease
MDWWLASSLAVSQVLTISWVAWVIISITLHELGHGWMAIRCGDDVPIHTGHMTLDPRVHIPPMAWMMFALFGFTWGLMPVQPLNFRGRYDDAKVSFAGPAVNLLLMVMCLVLDVLWVSYAIGVPDPYRQNVHTFLWVGVMINLMGFVFNLVPLPPLDGSAIVINFFPGYAKIFEGERGAVIGLVAFAFLCAVGSRHVWPAVREGAETMTRFGLDLTGGTWMPPY